ncbi:MAG: peptide transporter substrate-binding protein [Frankiales bacterium]|nr:peptide transporter substrate-binding protein [Frankiales bacterium]
MKTRFKLRSRLIAATAVAVVLALAGCTTSGHRPSPNPFGTSVAAKQPGGTATVVNFGAGPNYVFPLYSAQYFSQTNIANLQNLLFRPLYWYGVGTTPNINYPLSIAKPPVFSNGNQTVTITLNDYKWSDGTPVTARDVEFWHNMVKANKENFGAYSPGGYPDNIVKASVLNDETIRFDLDRAYDVNWFTYNELSQITPIPRHAWDKTSPNGAVGDVDRTAAGAKQVYVYLDGQSKDLSTYATNPLWQVVDGPWKLSSYTASNGNVSFVPNANYSGTTKPTLEKFVEKTFTSTDAVFKALLSGSGPDVGFISPVQLSSQPSLVRVGYKQTNAYSFAVNYELLNFNNPTVGPLFKQLYIRQVMQLLNDQKGKIKNYYNDLGDAGCGPIPIRPANNFADSYASSCPFAYDPVKAASLLTAHGWKVKRGGVSTCERPGTGPDQCGANIPAGKQLKIAFTYTTGGIAYPKTIAQMKSDAAKVGLDYELDGEDGNTLNSKVQSCQPSENACSWEMADGSWVYAPDYYPTGETLFQTGGGYNLGSYSDPQADALIAATTKPGDSKKTLDAYQDYLVQQIPVLWQENTFSLDEVKSNLHGPEPINIFDNITPEDWYFTK